MGKFCQFLTELSACHNLYFSFRTIVNVNIDFHKLGICIGKWRSGLGLLMDKFCQNLTKLLACHTFIFLFPDEST